MSLICVVNHNNALERQEKKEGDKGEVPGETCGSQWRVVKKNGNCYVLNCFLLKNTFRKSTKKVGLDKDRGMAEIHHSTQSRKRREKMEMEKKKSQESARTI
jgi:hypothetical protein